VPGGAGAGQAQRKLAVGVFAAGSLPLWGRVGVGASRAVARFQAGGGGRPAPPPARLRGAQRQYQWPPKAIFAGPQTRKYSTTSRSRNISSGCEATQIGGAPTSNQISGDDSFRSRIVNPVLHSGACAGLPQIGAGTRQRLARCPAPPNVGGDEQSSTHNHVNRSGVVRDGSGESAGLEPNLQCARPGSARMNESHRRSLRHGASNLGLRHYSR
jgi:hypothetical protein